MNGVNEQQVRRLDEMDGQQAHQFLTELLTNLSPEEEYAIRHEDYVMEMPQSGERFRGRENMRAFQEAYPTSPSSVRLRRVLVERVLVKEGLWVLEGVADYGGQVLDVVLILELRDGKMWRDRWYFAEPFEAPEWRTQWVERIETGAPYTSRKSPAVSPKRLRLSVPAPAYGLLSSTAATRPSEKVGCVAQVNSSGVQTCRRPL